MELLKETTSIHKQIKATSEKAAGELKSSLTKLDEEIANIENTNPGNKMPGLKQLNNSFGNLFNILDETDMPPTTQTIDGVRTSQIAFSRIVRLWNNIKTNSLPALNNELAKSGFFKNSIIR